MCRSIFPVTLAETLLTRLCLVIPAAGDIPGVVVIGRLAGLAVFGVLAVSPSTVRQV